MTLRGVGLTAGQKREDREGGREHGDHDDEPADRDVPQPFAHSSLILATAIPVG
jgi:hypothetical protein